MEISNATRTKALVVCDFDIIDVEANETYLWHRAILRLASQNFRQLIQHSIARSAQEGAMRGTSPDDAVRACLLSSAFSDY